MATFIRRLLASRFAVRWRIEIAILIFIGVGGYFLTTIAVNVWDEHKLRNFGINAPGYIVESWDDFEPAERGSGGFWFHGGTYTYHLPDGREYTGDLTGDGRKEYFEEQDVEVTYLEDNPTVSRISDSLPTGIIASLRSHFSSHFSNWIFSTFSLFLGFYLLRILIREEKHLFRLPESLQPHLL